jgi:hypothetical protein
MADISTTGTNDDDFAEGCHDVILFEFDRCETLGVILNFKWRSEEIPVVEMSCEWLNIIYV